MKTALLTLIGLLLSFNAFATTITWTNAGGGNWNDSSNWSPNQVPGAGDTANVTAEGTYTVTIDTDVTVAELNLGAASGEQTIILNSSDLSVTSAGAISQNGLLNANGNSGLSGTLTVEPGGVLNFGGGGVKTLYGLSLINRGTVHQLGDDLFAGNGQTTLITNEGLWDIQGNFGLQGVGSLPVVPSFQNTPGGTLRKSGGTGVARIISFEVDQQGSVEVDAGTLQMDGANGTRVLGGVVTVADGALFQLNSGAALGDGGVFSGAGASRFNGGTLTLNDDELSGLHLTGGTVVLGPMFQGDGAIHELTLNGSTLSGEHTIPEGGIFNANGNSGLSGTLTVEPGGVLNFGGGGVKTLYGLSLLNQGTVHQLGDDLFAGNGQTTAITNEGLWDIQGNFGLQGVGSLPVVPSFQNTPGGILRKSGGTGTARLINFDLINEAAIEPMMGRLRLPDDYENTGGVLRLAGGHLESGGTLLVSAGALEGTGSIGVSLFIGGTISPGVDGPGKITFTSGMNLGEGVLLSVDAKGSVPVEDHDQITVTGGINITNSPLNFTPTTSLGIGTKLLLIENDGADPINGAFSGYADGTLFDVNQELYRTWYTEGTGNDFAITRANAGARLTPVEFTMDGKYVFSGLGTNNATYTIYATPSVPTNVWEELGDVVADPGGKFEFTDPDAHLFKMRFYRSLGPP